MVDFEQLSNESGGGDGSNGEGQTPDGAAWQAGGGLESAMGVGAAAGPTKKKINEGMLLLLIVLVVAAAVLFLMRKTGSATIDQSLASVELKIEQALAQVSGNARPADGARGIDALLRNSDDVIAMFVNDPSNKQVPPDHLKKNPFYRLAAARTSDEPTRTVPVVTAEERRRQLRVQQLRSELSGLTLQTVMRGKTPVAVISNQVVREQDKLGSFTVVTIEPMAVVLTAEGNSYRLTMDPPLIKTRGGARD